MSEEENLSITDNTERAQYARVGLYALLPFIIAQLIFVFLQRKTVSGSDGINLTDLGDYQEYGSWATYAALVVSLIAWISVIAWVRRAYGNLHALGVKLKYSPSFVAWAWFIPLVNLVTPPIIMNELWKETSKAAGGDPGESQEESDSGSPVGLWWMFNLFAIGCVVAGILTVPEDADHWDAIRHIMLFTMASHVCVFIANCLAIAMIDGISKKEKALFARVEKQLEEGTFVLPEPTSSDSEQQ